MKISRGAIVGAAAAALLGAQTKPKPKPHAASLAPQFVLLPPPPGYNARVEAARADSDDFFWDWLAERHLDPTYGNVKDFLAPLKYVNAPWRYAGVILSPKGSTEKMRVIENGYRIDAGLTRQSPFDANHVWAGGTTHLFVHVGPQDELFGLDEHRQGDPVYRDGYWPIFSTVYRARGVTYRETVLAARMRPAYRSPYLDSPAVAAYIRLTALDGSGEVGFEMDAPEVQYGFPIVPAGFRHDKWTDAHNNIYAWFSPGGRYDAASGLLRYQLARGESAYVILPHDPQLAATVTAAGAANFAAAANRDLASWRAQLAAGGQVEVPEKVVMDAYRSLFIGDWQVSIGDELPYGMFSYYEGNGYAESLESIAPFIEYGYFADARRFIAPILNYPLSDTGIGLHVCANRLELAAYYFALSQDAGFIRQHQTRLVQVADYFLAHRQPRTGLVLDGYAFDNPNERVVNLNTNANGWRALRDLGLTLAAIGEPKLAAKYLAAATEFGAAVRRAVEANIDHATTPPFVPFALGSEKPYASLVESRASSYYNIVMPYFFESNLFSPQAEPFTDVLETMWHRQGVMVGLNRFNAHSGMFAQDGIHPLYTWGREYAQISRHEARRAVYTFYCALAHGYTRGTFLTGECQGTAPAAGQWQRDTYLPPEPPANALLLRSLRHLLIHEYDANHDGRYDALWLLSATPRGWLENGKEIRLEGMPTRFGAVSLTIRSELDRGRLEGSVNLPAGIADKKVPLFIRLPRGFRVTGAQAGGSRLRLSEREGDPVIELPARPGPNHFTIEVRKQT